VASVFGFLLSWIRRDGGRGVFTAPDGGADEGAQVQMAVATAAMNSRRQGTCPASRFRPARSAVLAVRQALVRRGW
jgi:hypothetical protein